MLARRLGTRAACATSSTVRALSVPLATKGRRLLACKRATRLDSTLRELRSHRTAARIPSAPARLIHEAGLFERDEPVIELTQTRVQIAHSLPVRQMHRAGRVLKHCAYAEEPQVADLAPGFTKACGWRTCRRSPPARRGDAVVAEEMTRHEAAFSSSSRRLPMLTASYAEYPRLS